ncbi:hypothetical protein LRP50_19475 [Enterovibrio sp. ZSDZ42]|uniref:DUF3325 domain-containing protein n=1 Tax=Enterovibrio gelatinilyticus TaxID=2899819 RepID=A0ABT5R4X4_9GAMM|nr:hypothetical protein [Enterovibrio sp. ZSDZ42]MDD1795316.1 hypothetical protein [Enterovibrio sp. ZSDZ42]
MDTLLYVAAILLVIISFAHSYLGERYILIRLFKRNNLPKLFGSDAFTKKTLRFAWHITSIAWCGFAALLVALAQPQLSLNIMASIIALTFFIHGLLSLLASQGKHLSWIVFFAICACIVIGISF